MRHYYGVASIMNVIGGDYLRSALESDGYFLKAVLNETAAYFFPYTTEHRDAVQPGFALSDSRRDKSNVVVGWLPSLNFAFGAA